MTAAERLIEEICSPRENAIQRAIRERTAPGTEPVDVRSLSPRARKALLGFYSHISAAGRLQKDLDAYGFVVSWPHRAPDAACGGDESEDMPLTQVKRADRITQPLQQAYAEDLNKKYQVIRELRQAATLAALGKKPADVADMLRQLKSDVAAV